MEPWMWSELISYVAPLLGCGAALGFLVGRGRARTPTPADALEHLPRRVALLERDLDDTQAELHRLLRERDFMRELEGADGDPDPDQPRMRRRRRIA